MLDDVAVLGAAGKMGSGIALLLLQEMAMVKREGFRLTLIDTHEAGLVGLRKYLKSQLKRYAEKNINALRQSYAEKPQLISNEEMIDFFVEEAIDQVRLETEITEACHSQLIIEAIVEDVAIKSEVFSTIDANAKQKPYYFSNTSSIPIGVLDKKSGLEGRLIGFHFYNPPPVQRLLEIIPAKTTSKELITVAESLAKSLNKVIVFSNDVAGFIGNGHFMREIAYSCAQIKNLEKTYSRNEAIWMMNQVTQDFLIRPMGMFQLIDYVGLDVCQKVMGIMQKYLETSFDLEVIDHFIQHGIRGGQNSDGSQKDGIFQYGKHGIEKIWDVSGYVDLPKTQLEEPPKGWASWKILHRDKNKGATLGPYFEQLFASKSEGAKLAQEQLYQSREIARQLVSDGVAHSIEDVNTVLQSGFYHLYGAENEWIPENAGVK